MSEALSTEQASKLLDSASANFDAASAIYNRMSKMATWTAEYAALNAQAAAHMAGGHVAMDRYKQWKDSLAAGNAGGIVIPAEWAEAAQDLAEAELNEAGK